MSKIKKMLAMLLAVIMVASLLTACGKKDSAADLPDFDDGFTASDERRDLGGLQLPLVKEKQELTVWLLYSGTIVTDLNDIAGIKAIEEATNVHINWVPVTQNELNEKYGILLASNNYPDIIYSNMNYPGGFELGVEDGVINADMDTLIRNYMPNYMATLAANEDARREATFDSGKMIVARTIVGTDTGAQSEGTYQGLAYRADLLEQLGMEVPTTVEGWHQVLLAAKAAGIPHPFNLDDNGGTPLSLAWGVNTDGFNHNMVLNGDKVENSALNEGFGQYLETMRQWYSEGLINPNFSSFNYYLNSPEAVNTNDILLFSRILSAFTGRNYVNYHMVTDQPDAYLQAVTNPVLNEGDAPIQSAQRITAKEGAYITSSCQNPILAAKWLDYLYTDEGINALWYGIEGETFEYVNGERVFTDKVFNNDSGLSTNDFLSQYALNWGNCWLGYHDVEASWKISTTAAGGFNQELESVAIWSEPETNIFLTSAITLTEEEGDEFATKMAALDTMVNEYVMNYIIGENVKPYAEFRQDLIDQGMERCVEIYQQAYDRYLAR